MRSEWSGALVRRLIALFALSLLGACATRSASSIGEVTLERTACFGSCPAYTVSIAPDGAVTFVGQNHTRVVGEQHGQADRAAVATLHRRIVTAGFFNLRDEYRADVSDLPDYIVTVRRGDLTKRVLDYAGTAAGMPQTVREIEEEIDRVAGTERWVGRDADEAPLAPTLEPQPSTP